MSIGFLIDVETPMVWRGPMVTQALEQMLNRNELADLDYLVVDMPPGTGDIQLTLAQKVPVTGAVIVTTPQDIALIDARKGLKMFEKVGVPILGIVENMSIHVCSNCGHADTSSAPVAARRCARTTTSISSGAAAGTGHPRNGRGQPTVVGAPDSKAGRHLPRHRARRVAVKVGETAKDMSSKFPSIVVQNT